jgi:outer membrane protein W
MQVCILLMGIPNAFAENAQEHFSLDYGNLTPTRTNDPKAEQFGQFTAKYNLGTFEIFKPYVGTGLAYSYLPDNNPGASTKVKTGVGGQAGFKVLLDEKSSLNFDYRFLDIGSDSVRGNSSSTPQSVGVGLEIKF